MQGPYSAAKAAARILMDTCRIELREYNLKFVSIHPGFIKTEAQLGYDQPMPLALSEEQAVKRMIRAMEKGSADYMFPWVYKMLIKLAGILPKGLLGRILLLDLPEEYGGQQPSVGLLRREPLLKQLRLRTIVQPHGPHGPVVDERAL